MNTQKQGRTPIYEAAFKIAVAREYLTTNLGYVSLGKKYNLSGDTIKHFVRWYKRHYGQENLNIAQQTTDIQNPAVDIKSTGEVHSALKDANLKIEALETLLEIASKELGVDIVKKLGARQLKK